MAGRPRGIGRRDSVDPLPGAPATSSVAVSGTVFPTLVVTAVRRTDQAPRGAAGETNDATLP